MIKKEYIIVEKTERNDWCLFRLAGYDKTKAEQKLAELVKQYPHKELKIEEIAKEDCWWNDPTMIK